MKFFKTIMIFAAAVMVFGCEQESPNEPFGGFPIIRTDGKILIEDQTGKRWDITEAVNKYGFDPEKFQFGVGPNAIPPIMNPRFYNPGETGYPGNGNFQVIGYERNGETRAYSLNKMVSHEVANEVFQDQQIAVAY